MKKDKKTLNIVAILDKSASMSSAINHTVNSFNEFINSQKNSLKHKTNVRVSLILFDHNYKEVYIDKPLSEVKTLTTEEYVDTGMGMTALFDAIGKTINAIKGNNTIVFIETDGEENSSAEFTGDVVKNLISSKKVMGWEFIFVGSDLSKSDTINMAKTFGITPDKVMNISKTSIGYNTRATAFSAATMSYADTGIVGDVSQAGDIKQ